MPHRVLFAIEALTIGGAEQMLVSLANGCALDGWDTHVVCLSWPGELADQLLPEVNFHVLQKKPGLDRHLPQAIQQLTSDIGPDVINTHLWTANTWMRACLWQQHVPIITTEHSSDSWKRLYHRWIDRALSRRSHRVIAVSQHAADYYVNRVGLKPSRVGVIHNGIDTLRFQHGHGLGLKQKLLNKQKFLVGTVGRMVPAKNHHRFVDMAKCLIDAGQAVQFVIAGDGPLHQDIARYANEQGIAERITLLGERRDVEHLMAAMDVFVLSSDREGHPLTALEAQTAGAPVVLTDVGGCAEAIAQQGEKCGGLLVSPDSKALAQAVQRLCEDAELRHDMGQFARQYAEDFFGQHTMKRAYQALFEQAILSCEQSRAA